MRKCNRILVSIKSETSSQKLLKKWEMINKTNCLPYEKTYKILTNLIKLKELHLWEVAWGA